MSRSAARPSHHFQEDKPHTPAPASVPEPVPTGVSPLSVAEPTAGPGPWLALLIWFAAYLGLSLTTWFDFLYGHLLR
jgi:hypothetical protein